MKRKVIQIAGSTQLVSLPRKWAKQHNIQKGDEVDVQESGTMVTVTAGSGSVIEKAEVDITNLKSMIPRFIRGMYKRGVDELRLTYSSPETLKIVQESIGKAAVGFEILEHGKNHCIIKYVAGNIEEFDSILRRTFMMLVSMADESLESIRSKNYSHLNNVAFLEEANNRFTNICRRYLNKNGVPKNYAKLGPLYLIVELLEKIADQYKYTCFYIAKEASSSTVIDKNVVEIYAKTNKLLHEMYELFYKFDLERAAMAKEFRDEIIDESYPLLKKKLSHIDLMVLHHSISTTNMIFGILGPHIILAA